MSHIINHFVIRNSDGRYWTARPKQQWIENIWFAKMYDEVSYAKRSVAYNSETTTIRIAELYDDVDGSVKRRDNGAA